MRQAHKYAPRTIGSSERYMHDTTISAGDLGLTVDTVTATVTSGDNNISVSAGAYSAANGQYTYLVTYSNVGCGTVKITTTYQGSSEVTVDLYRFRALDDGSGYLARTDYA